MPHSSQLLPPDPTGRLVRRATVANVGLGILWSSWVALTSWRGVDPLTVAGLGIAIAALIWLVGDSRKSALPVPFRVQAAVAGAAALAVWFPLPFFCVGLFTLGIHGLVLFPLFVAPIPLLVWGTACASGYLVRMAVAASRRSAPSERAPV